ncbi:MAG: chain-length determining protein [Rhodobacterales bacterium]|nr:MAG: chain-length determining protein [Rhodobacterales bacterium]
MGQIQSVGDFLGMVRRRIVLILCIVVLGTMASIWWTLGQPRVYEATAVAQIETPQVTDTGASPSGGTSADHRLRLLEQQLMARDHLITLIEKYDLFAETGLSLNFKVVALREAVQIVQITDPNAAWGTARVPTGLMISVTQTDAELAAALANEFLDALLRLNRERRSVAASQTLEFFQAEGARVEAEMAALEARIAEFKEQNADYLPTGIAAQRDELAALKVTLLELKQSLIELEASRTRQRADVIERQSGLLVQQQKLIENRIANIEAAIVSAPEVERQFNILDRDLERLKEQHAVITRRATDAEMGQLLESQQQFERIEVLETALVPENPVSGSRRKKVALGGFLSVMLGLVLALVLDYMNPAIRTRAQLERALDVKAVVAIPHLTPPRTQKRRRVLWLAALAALFAALIAIWGTVRDLVGGLIGSITGRLHGA